jgi:hypothetical protein
MTAIVRPLSHADLLAIWERGERLHPAQLAVELLQRAVPSLSADALWQLPLGQRDRLLLALREQTFGSRLRLAAACPRCRDALELSVHTHELCGDPVHLPTAEAEMGEAEVELELAPYRVWYRLPSSADLIAAAQHADPDRALRQILAGCVRALHMESGEPAADLPQEIVQAVAEQMSQRDPQGELLFGLRCPSCGTEWQAILDMASLLLRELQAEAERLLDEIHTLAAAYGWTEPAILSLSSKKRRAYLARCGASA